MRLTIVLDNFIVHDKQSCHSQLLVLNIDQETTHTKKGVQLLYFWLPKEPKEGGLSPVHLQHMEGA